MFDTEKLICEIETRPPLYDVQSKDYSNRELKSKCWIEVAQAMFEDWDSMSAKEKDERVKDLMKKWKSLRDCFMRDHRSATAAGTGKAASSKKRYVYYDQLQFILPYVKGNQNTHSNIAPPTEKKSSSNGDDEGNDDATVVNAVDIDENNQDQTPNDTNNVLGTSTSNNNKSSGKRKFENPNVVAGKRIALEKEFANSAKKLTNILSENLQMQREDKLSDKYGHKAFLLSFVPVLDSMPFHESMRLRSQISQIFTNYYSAQVNISSGPQTPGSTICSESNDEFLISDYINLQ